MYLKKKFILLFINQSWFVHLLFICFICDLGFHVVCFCFVFLHFYIYKYIFFGLYVNKICFALIQPQWLTGHKTPSYLLTFVFYWSALSTCIEHMQIRRIVLCEFFNLKKKNMSFSFIISLLHFSCHTHKCLLLLVQFMPTSAPNWSPNPQPHPWTLSRHTLPCPKCSAWTLPPPFFFFFSLFTSVSHIPTFNCSRHYFICVTSWVLCNTSAW